MAKLILFCALAPGLGAALLEWLQFRHAVMALPTALYILLVAISFVSAGLLRNPKLLSARS